MAVEHALQPLARLRGHTPFRFSRFAAHRLAVVGLAALTVTALLSVVGPMVVQSPKATDVTAMYVGPSSQHYFGTDHLGRDLFARVLAGGRVSLLVGLLATVMATAVGIAYGLFSGMGPRWVDHAMMQVLDAVLSIPVILLVIVAQAFGELSLLKVTIVIALASWMGTARIVRTECRRLMETDFIRAAVAVGTSPLGLVRRHLLPNLAAPLLVVLTVSVGQAIVLESTLSFLNLGVPATIPSWGNLLGNGMSAALTGAWWPVLFPGLMIVVTALSVNLIGDGLRDLIDPKRRSQY